MSKRTISIDELDQEVLVKYNQLRSYILEMWENDNGYVITTQTQTRANRQLPEMEIHCPTLSECLDNLKTIQGLNG